MSEDQVREETLRKACEAICSRCRSKLPLVKRNGSLFHEYHKGSDYRECYAHKLHGMLGTYDLLPETLTEV